MLNCAIAPGGAGKTFAGSGSKGRRATDLLGKAADRLPMLLGPVLVPTGDALGNIVPWESERGSGALSEAPASTQRRNIGEGDTLPLSDRPRLADKKPDVEGAGVFSRDHELVEANGVEALGAW